MGKAKLPQTTRQAKRLKVKPNKLKVTLDSSSQSSLGILRRISMVCTNSCLRTIWNQPKTERCTNWMKWESSTTSIQKSSKWSKKKTKTSKGWSRDTRRWLWKSRTNNTTIMSIAINHSTSPSPSLEGDSRTPSPIARWTNTFTSTGITRKAR